MSQTMWVRIEGDDAEDSDHSLILAMIDELDVLATHLEVRRLSEFYDAAGMAAGMVSDEVGSSDEQESDGWHNPREGLDSLGTIRDALERDATRLGFDEDTAQCLVIELEECAKRVAQAAARGRRFQFCIV